MKQFTHTKPRGCTPISALTITEASKITGVPTRYIKILAEKWLLFSLLDTTGERLISPWAIPQLRELAIKYTGYRTHSKHGRQHASRLAG